MVEKGGIRGDDVRGKDKTTEGSPWIGERVDIVKLAKSYKERDVQKEQEEVSFFSFKNFARSLGITESYEFRSPEALAKWYSMKPKLYALSAVMTGKIVDTYLNDRLRKDNQGEDSVSEISTFDGLESSMGASMKAARDEVLGLLKSRKGNPKMVEVYDELKSLMEFKMKFINPTTVIYGGEHYIEDDPEMEMQNFLQSGINTGVRVMSKLLRVIPKVYEREKIDLDPEDMKQTARNSFRLVTELASSHIYEFGVVYLNMENDKDFEPFGPEVFTLVDGELGKRLQIKGDFLRKYDPNEVAEKNHRFKYSGPDITGCPVMVNFGGGSAIRRLWYRNADEAGRIYKLQGHQRENMTIRKGNVAEEKV